MDREEFFRLKKIQSKKKRDTAAKELEDKQKRDRAEQEGERNVGVPAESANLLQDKDDDSESRFARAEFESYVTRLTESAPPQSSSEEVSSIL